MTLNREDEVRARLRTIASSLELKMPQAQLLLCQERFLARLSSLADGRAFIWKGGSLMLRLYRSLPAPRFTVDIDLLVKGRPVTDVPGILQRAMMHNLDDGFTFKGIVPEPMTRDTPNGGDRFSVGWTFFRKNSSQQLKIDVCAGDVVKSHRVQASDVFFCSKPTKNYPLMCTHLNSSLPRSWKLPSASELVTPASRTSSTCGR